MKSILFILAAGCVICLAGCGSTLETGYEYRPLGSSAAVRRGFYASPYTPEANAAQMEREQELEARRPRPGY
jgi:hypothetical protein